MSLGNAMRSFFAWYARCQTAGLVRIVTWLILVIICILWFVIDAILMGNIDRWL